MYVIYIYIYIHDTYIEYVITVYCNIYDDNLEILINDNCIFNSYKSLLVELEGRPQTKSFPCEACHPAPHMLRFALKAASCF